MIRDAEGERKRERLNESEKGVSVCVLRNWENLIDLHYTVDLT